MKSKLIAAAVLVATLVAPLGVEAAGKKEARREVAAEYYGPGSGLAQLSLPTGRGCEATMQQGCVAWDLLPKERYVRAEIDDEIATNTSGLILEFVEGKYSTETRFCTSQEKPIRLQAATTRIVVFVEAGPCDDGTPASGTSGIIRASFSRRP
jgi:hypothetical protein